jgi:hypothetical protein
VHTVAAVVESNENVCGFLPDRLPWRREYNIVLVDCYRLVELL